MDKDEAVRIRNNLLANLYSSKPQPEPELKLTREAAQAFTQRVGESEYSHQRRLHTWLVRNDILHFHCPNELIRDEKEGRAQSLIGMYPGVPDIVICEARYPYHGLYLELKSTDGVLSGAQSWWLFELDRRGYLSLASFSFEQSIEIVQAYLERPQWRLD